MAAKYGLDGEVKINYAMSQGIEIPQGEVRKPFRADLLATIKLTGGLNMTIKYYVRVGTTKRIVSKEELLRLFEASGSIHFDISPVNEASWVEVYQ